MSKELLKKIENLEHEIKVVRLASQQWDHIQKVYQESIERLQKIERELSNSQERTNRALFGGDLAWWDWEYISGNVYFVARNIHTHGRCDWNGRDPETIQTEPGTGRVSQCHCKISK